MEPGDDQAGVRMQQGHSQQKSERRGPLRVPYIWKVAGSTN